MPGAVDFVRITRQLWALALLLFSFQANLFSDTTRAISVGYIVVSTNTTVGGKTAIRGQNVFSGDTVNVENGTAVIAVGDAGKLVLDRNTQAYFEQKPNELTALLTHGSVSLYRPKGDRAFRLRTGNISVLPSPGRNTRAEVGMTDRTLIIATREGSVRVEGDGQPVDVPEGKAVRFLTEPNQTAGSPAQPAPAGTAPANPHWMRLVWCVTAGSALGSIPLIIHLETASASGSDWEGGLIPVGGLAGGLICHEIPEPSAGRCTLTADPPQVTEGESVTLNWTSPPGYSDFISGVGAEPSTGQTTVTPPSTGTQTYRMTGKGPAGTLVCAAEVNVVPKKNPTCTITATPAKLDKPGDTVEITWTLPPGATQARLYPERLKVPDLLTAKQPLKFKLDESQPFFIVGKNKDGTEFECRTKVDVPRITCDLRATPNADGKTVTVGWTTSNAANATLQAFVGDRTVGDPYEVPAGELTKGSEDFTPDRTVRYVLTVTGPPLLEKQCEIKVEVPSCDLWASRITTGAGKGKYQLNWRYSGLVNKLEFDPELTPKTNLRPGAYGSGDGKAVIDPTASTYTLTVTGGQGGRMVRSCTVDLKATVCKLDAPPEVAKTSKTFPIRWSVENATGATLETYVTGKPVGAAKPLDVSAGSGTIDRATPATSAEYVLTVTGPGGAKSQCRACVTIRQGEGKMLPIRPETQKAGMWCWLTAGEMVFTYYGVPNRYPPFFYQCAIVGTLFPNLCGFDCSKCAALGGGQGMREFITDMLKIYPPAVKKPPLSSEYVIRKDLKTCPLTEKHVKDEIDSGRPIIAGISTSGQHKYPPEHVAVIVGYEEVDGKLRLRVNDPYPFPADNDPYIKAGAQKNCGGSYYIDYDTYCNQLAWDSAWYNIKPAPK